MAEQRRSTVNVLCGVPNGVHLRVYEMAPPDAAGERRALQKGEGITLIPGLNEIDAEFWNAWAAQNADSVLVETGILRLETEEERARREQQKEFV